MKRKLIALVSVLTTVAALANADPALYGKPAPAIPGTEQLHGQPILVDFWASWCGPCQASFPWMNEMKRKYPELQIVAINLDEERKDAEIFLSKNNASFRILFDHEGELAEKYRVDGMPSSYLIDRNGKIVKHHVGFYADKASNYENDIENLLRAE